ncbi:CinA family protein [Paremcibacter congregatus]|nr:CinA family protein [Paremcibacter congregatus]
MFSPDIITLATQVLDAARARGLHLATAESCTGGLIMGALTEIAGSSDVVDRAFVTYTNRAKREMLGVPGDVIRQQGAVSEACARAMATGGLKASAASLTLSVTGIAGPGGGSEDKPVGLVHMACAVRDGTMLHEKHLFGDVGRDQVREATVVAGLKLILRAMG